MQVNLIRLALLFSVGFVSVRSPASCADATTPTPVEFWHRGDDSLSQKFAVAVERAFKRSPNFRLTASSKSRALVVMMTRTVDVEMIGKRARVKYDVRLSSLDDKMASNPSVQERFALATEVGTQRGSCWVNELAQCAAQIVSEADTARRKMPQ
jgi:hypothetical protein